MHKITRMQESVDSAQLRLNSLQACPNQHLKRFVEVLSAKRWFLKVAIKFWDADICVADLSTSKSVYLVLSQSASIV